VGWSGNAAQLRAIFEANNVHLETVLVQSFRGLDHLPLGAGVESYCVGHQGDRDFSGGLAFRRSPHG
jgi:hypothetical protein